MRTIGLIGGMSWESTLEYYRIMNEAVKERLGGLHSAKCIIFSVDFEEIEKLQHQGRWNEAEQILVHAAQGLEKAGAEFLLLATNTMHKLFENIQEQSSIPFLHIADATAQKIKEMEMSIVGLLGTKFTMEEGFYTERLAKKHEISILIPELEEREIVHQVIYTELCQGLIQESSRDKFNTIIKHLEKNGAQGIILGCTEIPLLIKQQDVSIPLFDTTRIHALAAVDYAIENE